MTWFGVAGTTAAVVVGAVLAWAGLLKLLAGAGWVKQAGDMGIDYRIAAVVPYVELTLGVSMAVQLVAPWSAVAAGCLLIVFTVLIGLRLADGSRPPCACFGIRSTRPLGHLDLVRNVVLIGLAVLAVASN